MQEINFDQTRVLKEICKGNGRGLIFAQIQEKLLYKTREVEALIAFLMQNGLIVRVNDGCNFYFRITHQGEEVIKKKENA